MVSATPSWTAKLVETRILVRNTKISKGRVPLHGCLLRAVDERLALVVYNKNPGFYDSRSRS